MEQTLKLLISQLESSIEGKNCYPNVSICKNVYNELEIGAIAIKDISDIFLTVKKILLEKNKSEIAEFLFTIDREATNKQKNYWKLSHDNFVCVYKWDINNGWNFILLEFDKGSKKFDKITKDNQYWNTEMLKELKALEMDTIFN